MSPQCRGGWGCGGGGATTIGTCLRGPLNSTPKRLPIFMPIKTKRGANWRFLVVNSHVVGRGGSKNYRVWEGSPSLTDVFVVLYLVLTVFQLTIPRELKFPRREGGVQVLGAVGVG